MRKGSQELDLNYRAILTVHDNHISEGDSSVERDSKTGT